MASLSQVKTYLSQWFQLGKHAVSSDGTSHYLPCPVFLGESYSPEFDRVWSEISLSNADNFYLEGTDQSIADLLSSDWTIEGCARCQMPIPASPYNWMCANCPCSDLSTWPNEHLPKPRSPAPTQLHLRSICERLHLQQEDSRLHSTQAIL